MTDTDGLPEPPPARAGLAGGWLTAIFVAVVAAGAIFAVLGDTPEVAEVGRRAPAVVFTSFDGEAIDLADHVASGEGPVLLNLWASWCEPCKREFPALSTFAQANPGITVVGVAVQDQFEPARAFAEEMEPTFLVGWDAEDSVRDAYPSFGLPATFLIDAEGVVTDIVLAELTPERLAALEFSS